MPTRVYDEKVGRTRNLIVVATLASLLLGVVLAFLLSRRNYGPIDALVQNLARKTGRTAARGRNEYLFIQGAMDDTLGENAKMSELLRRQNDVLRGSFLTNLLRGKLGDEAHMASAMESFDIRFPGDRFAVILFYIMDIGGLDGRQGSPEEDLAAARRLIAAAVEEAACRRHRGYVTDVDNMLACVVSFAGADGSEDSREAVRIATGATEAVHDLHGIAMTPSVSDVHESLAGIATAYREAMDVMEYKRAMDVEDTLCYGQISDSRRAYDYPMETEQQLINCIKAADLAAATAIVRDVLARNLSGGPLSNDMVRCLTFDLASTVLKTLSELSVAGDGGLLSKLEVAKRLMGCERVHEIEREMAAILGEVCAAVQSRRRPRRDRLIDEVLEHVAANYQDANLSVSSIAGRFQLTPTYLIRLFRDQTGEGVYHRIARIRMDRAKQLLRERGSSIKDVATKVGYYSSAAFIRAFKKTEGVTPGSFKDSA